MAHLTPLLRKNLISLEPANFALSSQQAISRDSWMRSGARQEKVRITSSRIYRLNLSIEIHGYAM